MAVTCTVNSINIVGLLPTDDVYYYKGYAPNYFSSQFKHELDFIVTDKSVDSVCVLWMVSNNIGGYYTHETNNYDCLSLLIEDNTLRLTELISGFANSSSVIIGENTKYYVRLRRRWGNLRCDLYSNEARTTLVDSINLVLYSSNSSFRYLYGMTSYFNGTVTSDSFSGVISNLALKSIIPLSVTRGMNSSLIPYLTVVLPTPRVIRGLNSNIDNVLTVNNTILRANRNLSSTILGQLNIDALHRITKNFISHISEPRLDFLRDPTLFTGETTLLSSRLAFISQTSSNISVIKRLSVGLAQSLLTEANIRRIRDLITHIYPEFSVSGDMSSKVINILASISPALVTRSNISVIKKLASEVISELSLTGHILTFPPIEIISLLSIITVLVSKNSNIETLVTQNSNITTLISKNSNIA